MKILFLGIAIAAILIATVPAIRDAGHAHSYSSSSSASSSVSQSANTQAPAAPAPQGAPVGADSASPQKYRSPLGKNGGLGNASLAESAAGKIKVYTLSTLPGERDGQVVRLRFSRPQYQAALSPDARTYSVNFIDYDNGGSAIVDFPIVGAEALDLIHSHTQPGLTFYVALEPGNLRAVGREWRADTRIYVW